MANKEPHPYEHLTDIGLLKELESLAAKATQCDDVAVSWYPQKDGSSSPQFEGPRGEILNTDDDYEFYAALRTAWPRIKSALQARQKLVDAMHRIAKPAIGGKQQQWEAQAVLKELGIAGR